MAKLKRRVRHTFAKSLVADLKSQKRFSRMFSTFAILGYGVGLIGWLITFLNTRIW